ncbi:hypothetical protein MTR67_020291 [Solanum verrucosum]|uniref:Uncharacterized protein n=1 Tax=Solanum verrucosum TaxID=315347 RepID=A0AAF0QUJ0_SOLVR|nr:hypothetical protein MTR67_020291 [Solanum verrucosum]
MAEGKRSLMLCCNLFSVLLLLLAEVLHFPECVEAAGSPVKFLPGFQGPLPFELETGENQFFALSLSARSWQDSKEESPANSVSAVSWGGVRGFVGMTGRTVKAAKNWRNALGGEYIGVGDSDDVQLFYYFIKSESNPKSDPLILWLTGGPGCSALSGLLFEIGPITFEPVEYGAFKPAEYNGSFPSLVLNPHTWTKIASFIFLDLPVGTGFSYARTSAARQSDDLQASDHAYQFLQKWFNDHPKFLRNPFYVAGDSYSGISIPIISQLIANGNEKGLEPFINLKGYFLGNPSTFQGEFNYRIPYAHGMGLISDELFESLKRNCKGEYFDIHLSNTQCLNDRQTYDQMVEGLEPGQILEPNCEFGSLRPQKWFGERRSLDEMLYAGRLRCRFDWEKLSYHWADDDRVREALHVRTGSIGKWKQCAEDDLPFEKIVHSSIPYHANLSVKGYRSLIYSGDHDMMIPYISTKDWIRSLNYSIVDDWRPWIVDSQVAGYTRTYSNKMTFATGGGHTAPEYKPVECLAMLRRWLSYQPL